MVNSAINPHSYDFACHHMPPNTNALGHFVGPWLVDSGYDNKVWNAWITVYLRPTAAANTESDMDCHGCRGVNTDGQDGKWKTLRIGYDKVLEAKTDDRGQSAWTLTLDHCQTGRSGNDGIPQVPCKPVAESSTLYVEVAALADYHTAAGGADTQIIPFSLAIQNLSPLDLASKVNTEASREQQVESESSIARAALRQRFSHLTVFKASISKSPKSPKPATR